MTTWHTTSPSQEMQINTKSSFFCCESSSNIATVWKENTQTMSNNLCCLVTEVDTREGDCSNAKISSENGKLFCVCQSFTQVNTMLWCYSECVSPLGRLKNLPGHGGNRTRNFGTPVRQEYTLRVTSKAW